jgi:hypothetical protein
MGMLWQRFVLTGPNESCRVLTGQFPLSDKTLKPLHDPIYYSRMVEGVNRSSKGQGRSFWRKFFQLRGDA